MAITSMAVNPTRTRLPAAIFTLPPATAAFNDPHLKPAKTLASGRMTEPIGTNITSAVVHSADELFRQTLTRRRTRPGPDDDYRYFFPQQTRGPNPTPIVWSDVAVDDAGPANTTNRESGIVYAVLGDPKGPNAAARNVRAMACSGRRIRRAAIPDWYVGDPGSPTLEKVQTVHSFPVT